MRVSLVRPDELGPSEIAAWQSMQRATPYLANPFLSSEFVVAVGRFRPYTQVAILTEGQSIVGFFPFERRQLGLGVPVCGWLNSCQGLIHAPGVEWDPRELLSGCRLSAWQFDSLITNQLPFKRYHSAIEPSAVIDLAGGFNAYYSKLRARSPRFCRELARRTRKLAREAGELRIAADARDASLLHTLIAWKSEQYRRTSHVDRFGRPWLVGLLDALLAVRDDHLTGVVSGLYVGDKPVAAQFGLRTGDLLVGWFTAYDVSFRKYSPGLIQFKKMIEELAVMRDTRDRHGRRRQELLQGDSEEPRNRRCTRNRDGLVCARNCAPRPQRLYAVGFKHYPPASESPPCCRSDPPPHWRCPPNLRSNLTWEPPVAAFLRPARRGISVDQGCCLRPVSGTARGVRASTLVSAMQQAKMIPTVSRQSRGQGTVEVSRPQPSQTSAVMNSIWDR